MARKVFFSFHYERDVWRANVVRNSWVTKRGRESPGFIDAVEFEELKRQGDLAVKKWINNQLKGTSVTVVLIGCETYLRKWVRYEILKSFDKGNGLLGIYIHNIKDKNKKRDCKGENPFEYVGVYIGKDGKAEYVEYKESWLLFLPYREWRKFDLLPKCSKKFPEELWTGEVYTLDELIKPAVYDWVKDKGYENIGDWVEEAAKQARRQRWHL